MNSSCKFDTKLLSKSRYRILIKMIFFLKEKRKKKKEKRKKKKEKRKKKKEKRKKKKEKRKKKKEKRIK
jgi:hypothetical protein